LATVIQKSRRGLVPIKGHTDSIGGDGRNRRLSEQRAAAVTTWLVTTAGIPAEVIKTQGFGKSKPVAPNTRPDGADNPEGRAKNRRVTIETGGESR
jgi:outer membrane protein OmpA-like peptidoglycan-associated protein